MVEKPVVNHSLRITKTREIKKKSERVSSLQDKEDSDRRRDKKKKWKQHSKIQVLKLDSIIKYSNNSPVKLVEGDST